MPCRGMTRLASAVHSERQEDGGAAPTILQALEREAMHLTRRDGKRRHVVQWDEDDPPVIEEIDHSLASGSLTLATVDLV